MEDERIETVKNWPKPKLMRDIQVFFGFAKFYQRFIQGFSRIAESLTSMLRITSPVQKLSKSTADDGDSGNYNGAIISGNCDKLGRSPNALKNSIKVSGYLTPDARTAFT